MVGLMPQNSYHYIIDLCHGLGLPIQPLMMHSSIKVANSIMSAVAIVT